MNCSTHVIQVTNVSPSTTSEQMRTLFGFLGSIEELRLFPPDDSPLPVTSRVCFVKFLEPESVGVSQHLTNTVFVDRALIVVPFAEGECFISKSLLAEYCSRENSCKYYTYILFKAGAMSSFMTSFCPCQEDKL